MFTSGVWERWNKTAVHAGGAFTRLPFTFFHQGAVPAHHPSLTARADVTRRFYGSDRKNTLPAALVSGVLPGV